MTARGRGVLLIATLLLAGPAAAQTDVPDWERVIRPATRPAPSAARKRPPIRIIVTPTTRNRHDSTEFPRADRLGYPGPNAVRQCRSWLATEHRPSGTVVTPQMRCWWQRG